jgi:formylglycine-generating enzyme required for sulfatase activity
VSRLDPFVRVGLIAACASCSPCREAGTAPPAELQCEVKRAFDCYVEVGAGSFLQGAQSVDPASPGYDPQAAPEEGPPRQVSLPGFWIHKYEVSAAQVERCQAAGACRPEDAARGGLSNIGREGHGHHPANSITWRGASDVCRWLGARLPTEAEWEYAARGPEALRFPWGDLPRCVGVDPSASRSHVEAQAAEASCERQGTSSPADLRQPGPFGTLGMAGNVWEWVEDWYADDSYRRDAPPAEGTLRVQRGGGWTSADPLEFRSAARGRMDPEAKLHDVGLRCVWEGGSR